MTSRRTEQSRSRTNTAMARPRSVMSKVVSSPQPEPFQLSSLRQPITPQDDVETNIQVVIRCRRRSDREIQDNSPIIVNCGDPRSHHVTVETSTPVSTFGVVTLPPTRTYPFDLVFGPEADQASIYHDVVGPMLDQVLLGYNCTLFAYGQTGTGKTHTMQGDLTPTPLGNPSAHAGMIPRALFRLFHHLEANVTDYSVKVSFVELYNEELRDLLSNDFSAPIGSTQPMGMGAGQTAKDAKPNSELKIFDDAGKRGVVIQGLEEVCVKDAADALALLTKGSQRRQIAATKFNDHSSRSHSVFSITVHCRESSALGEDLLKIGKLNLVDLAGSENIGRSGAENKRAREAGMINQSLLTLGRVINALVDRSSHVPYRESKLTRLLQDSLGGRTKTCIIATISPARCNMEETLSTLEYAMRAKNIRNKPELNQRMTRNSLLKEYVAEIERLKADLLAAREKNGIFFSEETWNQMTTEQELRQTEIEETRKHVELVESQMRSVREELEQSFALLMKRDGELKETKEQLKITAGELDHKSGELKLVQQALEEEIVVRQAYQENETILNEVASRLKKVTKENVRDVNGLFDKLHRKTSVFSSNAKAVATHSDAILAEANALSDKLNAFLKILSQSAHKLRDDVMQYQTKELKSLAMQSERIEEQLKDMHTILVGMQEKEDVSSDAVGVIENAIKDLSERMKNGLETWGHGLQKSCEDICQQAKSSNSSGIASMEKGLKAMSSLIETIVREVQECLHTEQNSITQANIFANNMVDAEITRLRQQNETLSRLLENERLQSERAKDQLIQRISGLLAEFTKERDRNLTDAVVSLQEMNGKAEGDAKTLSAGHAELLASMSKRCGITGTNLNKRSGEAKRTRDGALKALSKLQADSTARLNAIPTTITNSTHAYSAQVQKQVQDINSNCAGAFEHYHRAKKARLEATSAMATEVQAEFRYLQRSTTTASRNVDAIANRIASESHGLVDAAQTYHTATTSRLSGLTQVTRTLADQGTQEDVPTGTTPRKRVIEHVEQWPLTKGRDAILREWRKGGKSRGPSDTVSSEPILPSAPTKFTVPDPAGLDDVENMNPAPPPPLSGSPSSSTVQAPDPLPQPEKKVVTKPTGTLTDRPINAPESRRSRRAR